MQLLFQEEDLAQAEESRQAQNCRRVLVPYPVDKAYDYAVPDGMALRDGDYVCVPLGGREVPGVVWGDPAGDVAAKKLKTVVSHYDMPPMPRVHRDFIDWVSHYTMSAKGAVLKMALSVPSALEPPKPVKGYRISESRNLGISESRNLGISESHVPSLRGGDAGEAIQDMDRRVGSSEPSRDDDQSVLLASLSPQRQKVMAVLSDGQALRASEIAELAGCSAGVVKGMADKGLLEVVEQYSAAPCRRPDPHRAGPALSADQRAVADRLTGYVSQGGYHAGLLDGVTGAGKTEVYFEAVAEALKSDRQVLILLPEIALSNAFLERFKARFGCAPALWHSNLTPAQRRTTWRGVATGETKVVVGARSALFLPYADLGLIVIDEEHDPAYKQEEGVIYHARDMAIVRANLGRIPIVLVSATPALETIHNAWPKPIGNARYDHLHLPDRFGGARLPDIETIDLRVDKPERQEFISPRLRTEMLQTLEAGEQVLLFLNRRGYAPLTLCRSCGHRMECPRCTAWLVEHKQSGKLQCHHCGYDMQTPQQCPSCGDEDTFAPCGPGVERIYEEVKTYFPDAKVMLLASDTADNNEKLRAMLEDIREGRVDIVIGTQIIAKGHHFPNLTCVGVIDADLGLQGGELRASERTYQLLHQVAGRAGRAEKKGHVYLQSFMPEHRIMKALVNSTQRLPRESVGGTKEEMDEGGRDLFLRTEAAEREASHMPPYSRLVGIIISGRDERQVLETAKALGMCAPQGHGIQTLGPAPAPFAKLRGRYRYRLLVRADKKIDVQKTVAAWVRGIKTPSTVRIQIDIDPQSFL